MNLKEISKVLIEKSFLSSFLAGLINFQNTILPKEATLHADSCLEYIYIIWLLLNYAAEGFYFNWNFIPNQ